jgi:hypothetical protein
VHGAVPPGVAASSGPPLAARPSIPSPVAATIAPVAAWVRHGLQTPQQTAGALFPSAG